MTQDDAAATSPVVGIDLGTTNSVVAGWVDGKVQVLQKTVRHSCRRWSASLPTVACSLAKRP